MGTPFFKVRSLCQANGVVAFSSNYELYGDMSGRVMETLRSLARMWVSIRSTRAFLDLDRMPGLDLWRYAREVGEIVTRHTGIPVSVVSAQPRRGPRPRTATPSTGRPMARG
jgi:DNA polymerase V